VNRLFLELYLDEDVSVPVADLLRARGFSVQTTQGAGRNATRDEDQLSYAASQRRTLLTHNRDDFARLAEEYFTGGRKHYGIIIAVRRPAHEITRRLLIILNQVTADEVEDQVIYIQLHHYPFARASNSRLQKIPSALIYRDGYSISSGRRTYIQLFALYCVVMPNHSAQ
jgi:predicted nuclease of predicted toxin-antitoxin system